MSKKKSKKTNVYLDYLRRFWRYMWYDDSLGSYVVNFVVAFIFIKYLLFPGFGLILNNDFPIVAVVSGSMQHKIVDGKLCEYRNPGENRRVNFDEWWDICGDYYIENFDISKEQFKEFKYKRGFDIGAVMVLYGKKPENIDIGEILVFVPQDKLSNGESYFFRTKGPVIHRVVDKWQDENGEYHFQTKGDWNPDSKGENVQGASAFSDFESDIPEEDVIGVAVLKIPWIGYVKIVLTNIWLFLVS